ncbi:MAG: hypothetical protein IKC87_04255 [Clostridia bacterium]|nr:hypothetical protein [Clostridia bacterium]
MPKEISNILLLLLLPIGLVLIVVNTISACTASFNFYNPESMITAISIVKLSFDEEDKLQIEELKNVDNIDAFIEDFKKVESSCRTGDPLGAADGDNNGVAIMISYSNGEYELIGHIGQSTYRTERGLVYYDGFFSFDKEQFNALIEKYLAE